MIMGISYSFFILNAVLNYMIFIWTSNFIAILMLAPFIHFIAYMVCLKEPRMMELLVLKMNKGMKCRNWKFHGYTNSYDVF